MDEESGTLTVRHALKRAPNGARVLGGPKTAKSKRTVSMPVPVVQALKARRRLHAAERLVARPG